MPAKKEVIEAVDKKKEGAFGARNNRRKPRRSLDQQPPKKTQEME